MRNSGRSLGAARGAGPGAWISSGAGQKRPSPAVDLHDAGCRRGGSGSVQRVAGTESSRAVEEEERRPVPQKPKLGALGKFSQGNLDFTWEEGFTSIGLWAGRNSSLDMGDGTEEQIAKVETAPRHRDCTASCSSSYRSREPRRPPWDSPL